MKKRLNNWPGLLAAKIEELRAKPFVWGQNDCCLMAANLIEAITGYDPMRHYRGTYATKEDAEALLESLGGIEAAAESVAINEGWQEVPVAMLGRGDLALIQHDVGKSLGVCEGSLIVSPSPSGLAFFQRKTARKAWRVG